MQSLRTGSLKLVFALLAISALFFPAQVPATGQIVVGGFIQHNLVSDIPNMAITTDPNLKNPWGIAFSPTSPFWISDNGTGVSTLYNTNAQKLGLTVTIPPPMGSSDMATPTGIVFNGTSNFVVSSGGRSGSAVFIFATEDGTISGWNPNVNSTAAILAVDNSSSGAVYKGLALASSRSGNFLFATDFHNNAVQVFDSQFHLVNSFTDLSLPPGFAPFGITSIQGQLYVSFALQEAPDNEDDEPGPGNGFVDVFSPTGQLVRRFASQGTLNSPWGMVYAQSFGSFSNALLVGNFGDGTINAFDFTTGEFLGQLRNTQGQPIRIDGLWALTFGNGGQGGHSSVLYFTAGLNDEEDGLFGDLQPADSNAGIFNP
ncbi:MAG: TIGR03118 family protein [Blastocatellia bacterium]